MADPICCPFCDAPLDPEAFDYVARSATAKARDPRIHVRCPHCTEVSALTDDGTALVDPDAESDALAFAADDERRYGPANSPADYGEG